MEYLTYPFHGTASSSTAPGLAAAAAPESEHASSPAASLPADSQEDSLRDHLDYVPSIGSFQSNASSSSTALVQRNNAAFAQIRTAVNDKQSDPAEWAYCEAPAVSKCDWRSYGPVQAQVITMSLSSPQTATRKDLRKLAKKRLDEAPSTLWTGTVWQTERQLLFVLASDSSVEVLDAEIKAKTGWLSSVLQALNSPRLEQKTKQVIDNIERPVPRLCSDSGHPYTAFAVPYDTMFDLAYIRGSAERKRRSGKSSSSSRSRSASRAASTTASPALSRSHTRNSTRTTTQSSGPSEGNNEGSDVNPTISFADLEGSSDSPDILSFLAKSDSELARVELKFLNRLYAREAEDLWERLQARVTN